MTALGMAAWAGLAVTACALYLLLFPGPPVRQHVDLFDEQPQGDGYDTARDVLRGTAVIVTRADEGGPL